MRLSSSLKPFHDEHNIAWRDFRNYTITPYNSNAPSTPFEKPNWLLDIRMDTLVEFDSPLEPKMYVDPQLFAAAWPQESKRWFYVPSSTFSNKSYYFSQSPDKLMAEFHYHSDAFAPSRLPEVDFSELESAQPTVTYHFKTLQSDGYGGRIFTIQMDNAACIKHLFKTNPAVAEDIVRFENADTKVVILVDLVGPWHGISPDPLYTDVSYTDEQYSPKITTVNNRQPMFYFGKYFNKHFVQQFTEHFNPAIKLCKILQRDTSETQTTPKAKWEWCVDLNRHAFPSSPYLPKFLSKSCWSPDPFVRLALTKAINKAHLNGPDLNTEAQLNNQLSFYIK